MNKSSDTYQSLLHVISKQLQYNDEKQEFEDRIPSLSKKLSEFSNYFSSLIDIAFDPSLKRVDRIHKIAELRCCGNKGMSISQASNIVSRLYSPDAQPYFNKKTLPTVFGGAIGQSPQANLSYIPLSQNELVNKTMQQGTPERIARERDGNTGDLKNWLPRFIEKSMVDDRFRGVNTKYDIAGDRGASAAAKFGRIFKYFLLKLPMTYGLKFMYSLAGSPIEGIQVEDFVKKMDFTYYILFVLANIPFFGFFANVYTILTAIDDGRIYLACITLIGTILSLFTLHYFDMGLFFKIFYWMDVNYEVDGHKPPVLPNPDDANKTVRITGGSAIRRRTRRNRKRRVLRRMR